MINDVRPTISLAENEYLFKKISEKSEGVSFELFISWLHKYSEQGVKPLIVFKEGMMPELIDEVKHIDIPLSIHKLVEEMRNYGIAHVEDAFNQAIDDTKKEFVGRKEFESKVISLSNFKKFLSVVNTGSSDDMNKLKTWLLENELAERYIRLNNYQLEIELAINSERVWDILMKRYREPSAFKMQLQGGTILELASSIKHAVLKRKVNEIHKVPSLFTIDAKCSWK